MEETPVKETQTEDTQTDKAPAEEVSKKPSKKPSNRKAAILVLLALLIGIGVGVYFATKRDADDGRIPYAQGVVLLGGEEIDQNEKGWISLVYNHKAFSGDGVNFSCFLTNDASNLYDLYFDIYADDTLEDEIFLSGLLPPGTGLRNIELTHALPTGSTMCYVVFNQVDTDGDGNQSIVGQTVVTVEFVVE